MADAERLAAEAGFRRIAVISGVGTRDYYRKLGYELDPDGDFLIKDLKRPRLVDRMLLGYGVVLLLAGLSLTAR